MNLQVHQHTNQLTNQPTHQLANSSTHNLPNSQSPQLTVLNYYLLFLQYCSDFHSVLAKILVKKQVNYYYFLLFTSSKVSVFENITSILHHLAFLVWSSARNFSCPITHFQTLKPYFLTAILPFLVLFLVALKGFVYTIAAYFYAFCLPFSCILHCVLHQNALHLAAKRTAFSIKTSCNQHHIALHLAAIDPKMGANDGLFK